MLDSQEGTAVMYSKGYPPLYIYKYYINIYLCKHLLFDMFASKCFGGTKKGKSFILNNNNHEIIRKEFTHMHYIKNQEIVSIFSLKLYEEITKENKLCNLDTIFKYFKKLTPHLVKNFLESLDEYIFKTDKRKLRY